MTRPAEYTLIDSTIALNYFISRQHYESCSWARQVKPEVQRCFDCPFPVCVEGDLQVKNQNTRPKYIEQFLKGAI